MPVGELMDLHACDREPIHIPGTIQPYGVLLVIDPTNDLILQATANSERLIAFDGPVIGRTLEKLLGVSLAALVRRADTVLLCEPTFLGVVGPFGDGKELTITAHRVEEAVIVELEPAANFESAARTLAKIRLITERVGGAGDMLEACTLAA